MGKGLYFLESGKRLNYYSPPLIERKIIIAKSIGKVFEQNWKKSIPNNIFCYKPPDAAQAFDMSSNLRFSHRSPCDYMMFDGDIFYTLELKSFDGSCSFERSEEDKGIIHYYQIDSLKNLAKYKNICSGFILDFRKTNHTYFLDIKEWDNLTESISKKSFNEQDMFKYCNPIVIKKEKLKVNYRYDIDGFMAYVKNTRDFSHGMN